MDANRQYILGLKQYMIAQLQQHIPGILFNGDITPEGSNYKVLSVSLPPNEKAELTLFNLDMAGIAASGGSACTSGSEKGSHVLEGIHADPARKAVRFSFSKHTTQDEIDYAVEVLKGIIAPVKVGV
jgi:cysteine desulfurase